MEDSARSQRQRHVTRYRRGPGGEETKAPKLALRLRIGRSAMPCEGQGVSVSYTSGATLA